MTGYVCDWVCVCDWMCVTGYVYAGITLTFLHSSTSDLTYKLTLLPGEGFRMLLRPKFSFVVCANTLKVTEPALPVVQSFTLIRLPCSGRVALSYLRFTVATASVDSSVT